MKVLMHILISLTFCVCGAAPGFSQNNTPAKNPSDIGWQVVELEQEWQRNTSQATLERLLLNEARHEAINRAAGVHVHLLESVANTERSAPDSPTHRSNYLYLSFQESAGRIVEERPPVYTTVQRDGKTQLRIDYRGKVALDEGKRDPAFGGSLRTHQPAYRVHDTIKVNVESSLDAALYLFNMDARGNAVLIWPNKVEPSNKIGAGVATRLPRDVNRYAFVAEWPADETDGQEPVQEALLAILYRGSTALFQPEDAFVKTYTHAELSAMMLRIPRSLRTEMLTSYMIVAQ